MFQTYFRGYSLRLIKPSQNCVTVITRAYAKPIRESPTYTRPQDALTTTLDPSQIAEKEEIKRIVREALRYLTDKERLVVRLHFGFADDPWSLQEIAELLRVERADVKLTLLRALKKLREPLSHLT